MSNMRRRDFIALLGGTAAAWPLAARAQQPSMPVVGFLNGQLPSTFSHLVAAFRLGLEEAGYVEDRNVRIEYRWAEGRIDVLPALAAELIQRPVDLIIAAGGAHAVAKAATASIPIVFTTPGQPIKEGLVASLNRSGGNATGISVFSTTLEAKRLELLHELVPRATAIGVLIDPSFWTANLTVPELRLAAEVLGVKLQIINVSSEAEIGTIFSDPGRLGVEAVAVTAGPFLNSLRNRIVELTARSHLPVEAREFAAAGGLMAYGPSIPDIYRWVGIYAGRILKGAKPADLPVLQPSKFHLVVNLKTAKALGLEVAPTLLARADEVIE
jgi:putative tryptophan/tyrosine transport system substrate-binding protein